MPVNEKIDSKKYRGTSGSLRRYFETPVAVGHGKFEQSMPLGNAVKQDVMGGLFWNATGREWNTITSLGAGAVVGIMTFVSGFMYGVSEDVVSVSGNEHIEVLEITGLQSFTSGQGATIIARGDEAVPYIFTQDQGRIFIYEPIHTTEETQNFDDAGDMLQNHNWEWRLMAPQEAYSVLLDFEAATGIYNRAEDAKQLRFLSQISPITEYTADFLSPAYVERSEINMTAAKFGRSDQVMTLNYAHALQEGFEHLIEQVESGLYGYADGQAPAYSDHDFNEETLSPLAGWWFGSFLPFFFGVGAGIGGVRAGTRMAKVAIKGGDEKPAKAPRP